MKPIKFVKSCVLLLSLILIFFNTAVLAERLSVSVPTANIRSGSGTEYEILWKVEKYHPLSILKKSGSWYYFVDFERDEGWIHKSVVSNIPSVITKKDECNIRSGPGIRFDIVFKVEKGVPFKVINRKDGWIHILHADGDKGWMHKKLVW